MIRNSLVPTAIAQLPWRILLLVLAIGGFGLVVLYSAAGGSVKPWAWSQGLRFILFLVAAAFLSRVPEVRLREIAFPSYVLLVLLLVLVELLGAVRGGSRRWLDLGFLRLQPSELMKPVIVLALARFYDLLPAGEIRGWNALWPAAVLLGVPAGLVMLQPDLGTALMIALAPRTFHLQWHTKHLDA